MLEKVVGNRLRTRIESHFMSNILQSAYKQFHSTETALLKVCNDHHHLKAGDTHIYLSLATPDTNVSLNQLRDCPQNVFHWMTNSKLKINANKTEFLIILTQKQRVKLYCYFPASMLSKNFTPAISARNLGVTF